MAYEKSLLRNEQAKISIQRARRLPTAEVDDLLAT